MNYKSRSYRIDDEVAEAIQKLPVSLNQFLRSVLSANGVFEPPPQVEIVETHGRGESGTRIPYQVRRELRPKGDAKR